MARALFWNTTNRPKPGSQCWGGDFMYSEEANNWVCVYLPKSPFAVGQWFSIELLHIHRQSAYLIGRDRLVADIAIDHPSCSKQHAVIQCMLIPIYKRKLLILSLDRYVQEKDEFGDSKGIVKSAALFPDYLFLSLQFQTVCHWPWINQWNPRQWRGDSCSTILWAQGWRW